MFHDKKNKPYLCQAGQTTCLERAREMEKREVKTVSHRHMLETFRFGRLKSRNKANQHGNVVSFSTQFTDESIYFLTAIDGCCWQFLYLCSCLHKINSAPRFVFYFRFPSTLLCIAIARYIDVNQIKYKKGRAATVVVFSLIVTFGCSNYSTRHLLLNSYSFRSRTNEIRSVRAQQLSFIQSKIWADI